MVFEDRLFCTGGAQSSPVRGVVKKKSPEEKAKENLVIAAGMTNQKLGNSTGLLKSTKALESVDTKKELAKLAHSAFK